MEAEIPTTPEPKGSHCQCKHLPGPQLGEPAERERPSAARRHARRLLETASDELTRIAVKGSVAGVLTVIAYAVNHWR
ncbi:hypothetical protein [Streptomyces longisporoflavus]|uniref:Uncharacterized protein n=1 Tax=Streptomyces longisporoflavus TaxID=28044 RepID=A0ABW7QIP6_9ACTN